MQTKTNLVTSTRCHMVWAFVLCQVGREIFFFLNVWQKSRPSSSMAVFLESFAEVQIHQSRLMEDKRTHLELKRKGKFLWQKILISQTSDTKKIVLSESGLRLWLNTMESSTKQQGLASVVLISGEFILLLQHFAHPWVGGYGQPPCDADFKQILGIFFTGWDGGRNTFFPPCISTDIP